MTPDSPQPANRPPHPLALALITRLADRPRACVLEVGGGSGRNTRALIEAGFRVVGLSDGVICAAALSTHALLHGTRDEVRHLLTEIFEHLAPGAALFATFGSVGDTRYGRGTRIAEGTYAPVSGDERGVPHAFFDETSLRAVFEPDWRIESLREEMVDAIAGSWAHVEQPLHGARHWFAVAHRP